MHDPSNTWLNRKRACVQPAWRETPFPPSRIPASIEISIKLIVCLNTVSFSSCLWCHVLWKVLISCIKVLIIKHFVFLCAHEAQVCKRK